MSAGQVSGKMTKLAWKRNPDVPAGQPALGRFDCVCGTTISEVEFGGPAVTCAGCGQTWDGRGWLIGEPTTTELAAIIEASPRFDADPSAYFDALAGKYGRDFTGIAWTQACLKRDQEPAGMTYDEALQLAAKLYGARRITEMALHGYPQYELPRVSEADRPATEAMLADLKADSNAITAVTRRGRDEWPASLRAIPLGAGLLGYPNGRQA